MGPQCSVDDGERGGGIIQEPVALSSLELCNEQ